MPERPRRAQLTTARLLLRRWREDDRAAFAELNADREVMRLFPSPLTARESDALIAHIEAHFERHGFGLWALEHRGQGELLGLTGLCFVSFDAPFTPAVEIGWRLRRSAWGHGFASEAASTSLAFGFDELGVDEIVSFTSTRNAPSRAVMERIGMTRDRAGDFAHPLIAPDSPLAAHVLYRMTAADWRGHSGGQAERELPAALRSPRRSDGRMLGAKARVREGVVKREERSMESGVTEAKARGPMVVEAQTVAEAFRITAAERTDQVAIRTKGDAFTITWGELQARVDALAGGLAELGVGRGETVALMLSNRPEFHLCDLAAMMLGATPFSIYNTYSPEQIGYLLSDAEAKTVICEQQYLGQVLEAKTAAMSVENVIVIDGEAPRGTLALSDVEGSNPGFDVEASVAKLQGSDVLTLIYTSGTTGPPKGVQLIHRNLLAAVEGLDELIEFPRDGRVISWLPAAHVAERNAHHYLPMVFGLQITCCDDPRQVLSYLPEVRPSWFFAVPRIWEKLKAGLETMMAAQPDEQQQRMQAALDAALRKVRLEQSGQQVPAELAEQVAQADTEIFAGLRATLGLDQVEAINVGAAPTPVEVLEFFHAIGLPLAELWGMSETCGAGTVNPTDRIKIGTVGPPAPGVQIKLDSDGEVLIKSDVVMAGYRNLPEKTKETFTEDGWLRTGDIGEFDEDGYLKIVDRKKELIISAGGKNMSPANIEASLKTASPLIGQACCIGDGRPYNTALIVLDTDFAPAWAAGQGIQETALESLARDERVRAAVQEGVDAANEKLARVEQIKRFTIVEGDWLPSGDELTPTMKLKRKPIAEKYAAQIVAMYP